MSEYYDIVMALTAVPKWQLNELATVLHPARMMTMVDISGYPMFKHEDASYVHSVQALARVETDNAES